MFSKLIRRGAIGAALATAAFLAIPSTQAEAQNRYRRGGYSNYYRPVTPGYSYRSIQTYRPAYVNPYSVYPSYRVPSYSRYYNSYRIPGGGYGVGGYPLRPSYGGGGYPIGPSYGGGFGIYIGR